MASCGYFELGQPGKMCQIDIPLQQLATRRFQNGGEGVLENTHLLADDLKERGKLDLSECFIDGTFVTAKKGGGQWERPSGAKVQRSWQWQTALVFLSPFTLQVLRRMKSPLWKRLSHLDLSQPSHND
jgi:hypothetical protein